MNKLIRSILSLLLAAMLLGSAALADVVSFDGKVTAASTYELLAPLGGPVASMELRVGQEVTADQTAVLLRTTKYYASEDGTVAAVFGQVGDNAADVVARYGAVGAIERGMNYTINANYNSAYSTAETTLLHVGQTVYLRDRSNTSITGEGIITVINATAYTIEVTKGDLVVGNTMYIYLEDTCRDSQRTGRGTVERTSPMYVTSETGVIVNLPIKAGDTVKRGDLLMETLDGTATYTGASDRILCGVEGVVASVAVAQGDVIAQDALVASIYPADAMQIEGLVSESDLGGVQVGGKVEITLYWNEDDEVIYDGVITGISAVADAASAETSYNVTVSFTPDSDTRYGMNATVTTVESKRR